MKQVLILSAVLAVVIAAVLLRPVLFPKEPSKTRPTIPPSRYLPATEEEESLPPLRLVDVTERSGVDFRHVQGGFRLPDGGESRWLPECMGAGLSIFDGDGDGDLDLFFVQSGEFPSRQEGRKPWRSRFFRNEGGMRFVDASAETGLDLLAYGMGSCAADYDGDGDTDLVVTTWGGPILLRNEGGRFVDVTDEVGLRSPGWEDESGHSGPDWSTTAAFFDAEGDGDLDLLVANYVRWTPETDVFATLDGKRKSFTIPDQYHGNSCRFFVQQDGRFFDRTESAGFLNDEGKSLGIAFWDFEEDGLLDVVIANDQQPNFLYRNLGEGRFEERGEDAGIAYDENARTRAGMGIDAADYANDGIVGIPIGNFSGEPVALYRMDAPGLFRDVTQMAGVARQTQASLTFGVSWADLDLDGWQDLVLANGHLEPHIQDVQRDIPWAQSPQALRNLGGEGRPGRFANWAPAASEDFTRPLVGRGLAVADLDEDGDLDLVISTNAGRARVLRNDLVEGDRGPAWLRVKLVGKAPNTDALGAWITVEAGGLKQRRLVRSGSSYASSTEFVQTFGLGATERVERLEVRWPDGSTEVLEDVAARRKVVIRQGP